MTGNDASESEKGQVTLDGSIANLPPVADRFLNIFSRPETRNAVFRDQKVLLDGRVFVHCQFENCELDFSGVNYDLIGCTFDASTTIISRGELADLMQRYDSNFPWANQHLPAFFVPMKHEGEAARLWFVGKLY